MPSMLIVVVVLVLHQPLLRLYILYIPQLWIKTPITIMAQAAVMFILSLKITPTPKAMAEAPNSDDCQTEYLALIN